MVTRADLILFKESGLELAQSQLSNLERLQEKLLGRTPSMRGKLTTILHTTIKQMIQDRRVFIISHLFHINGVEGDAVAINQFLNEYPDRDEA